MLVVKLRHKTNSSAELIAHYDNLKLSVLLCCKMTCIEFFYNVLFLARKDVFLQI